MVIFAQSLSTNKKLVEKVRLCYKRAYFLYVGINGKKDEVP